MPDLFVQFHFIESWTEQHVDPLPVFLHSDDGPGSLREGCRRKEPLWIVFEISGTIHLSSYLSVSSHKTIDGRGQRIKLTGKGLRLKECENIIICNLEFEGGRGHDVDGIQIKPNSRNIWIDRCSLRDYDDGLIDITRQSTDITISRWVHFSISISNWSDWSNVLCCECDVILFLFFLLVAPDVTLHSMTRPCSLELTRHTLVIDASGWRFIIVSLMEHAKDSLVWDLEKFICTTITPETGEYMLFVPVLSPRWLCCYHPQPFIYIFILHSKLYARGVKITDFSKIILQIYSQCNIYEAGTKKKTFEFYTEKV